MRLVKIGIANVNSTVGAVRSNVDQCITLAHAMANENATVALFPEQVVGATPWKTWCSGGASSPPSGAS